MDTSDNICNLWKRLKETTDALLEDRAPCLKEVRGFKVDAPPFMLQLLARYCFYPRHEFDWAISGSTQAVLNIDATDLWLLPSDKLIRKFLFSGPVWLLRKAQKTEIIPIKLTTKVRFPSSSNTMQDEMRLLIRNLCVTNSYIPTFYELATQLGYGSVLDLGLSHVYFRDLTRLAFLSVDTYSQEFIDHLETFKNNYRRRTDLTLRTKVYVERADVRAFCVDKNPMRHLCGTILDHLFLPRQIGVRQKLASNYVLPGVQRNLLDKEFTTSKRSVARFSHGDISSFTANVLAAWIMLLSMAHQYGTGTVKRFPPFCVSIGDQLLEVDFFQVLLVYLFTAPFAKMYCPELNITQYQYGGNLGVSFNINSSLLWLAFYFHIKVYQSLLLNITFCPQLGGDDFCWFISGPRNVIDKFEEEISNELRQYTGFVKVLHTYEMPFLEQDAIIPGLFCKKRVRWIRTFNGTRWVDRIMTLINFPLMTSYMLTPFSGAQRQVKMYQSMQSGLKDVLKSEVEFEELLDFYSELMFAVNHPPQFSELTQGSHYADSVRFPIQLGRTCLTVTAQDKICVVPERQLSDETILLADYASKLRFLLRSGVLVRAELTTPFNSATSIVFESEDRENYKRRHTQVYSRGAVKEDWQTLFEEVVEAYGLLLRITNTMY